MTEYTIGEAAQILGVTTRTLRHWDQIGLFAPSFRTWSEHRIYTDDDLDAALRILIYREAGLPLKEILSLTREGGPAEAMLRRQREVLVERIGQLHGMVRAVDTLLEGGHVMTMDEKVKIFGQNLPNYQAEAEARWGDTPEWQQAQAAQASMSLQDWEQVKRDHDAFVAQLTSAREGGVEPGSPEATPLVEAHRRSIEYFYEATLEKQVLLGRLYATEEKFQEMYGGEAEYLHAIIDGEAVRQGLNLDEVAWR